MAEETPVEKPRARIRHIPVAGLEYLWPLAENFLAPLYDESPLENTDDVRASIENDQRGLYLILVDGEPRGALVVQVIIYPRARVLEVMALAARGLRDLWPALPAWAEALAVEKNCSVIQVIGRTGWTKYFREYSGEIKQAAVVYQKVT